MTGADGWLLGLAAVDLLAVVGMGLAGMKFAGTAKQAQQRVGPALREAKALAEIGKEMANHAQRDGKMVAARVNNLVARLKKRVETTKRIVGELKPAGEAAAADVREIARQRQVVQTTAQLSDISRRLLRLRSAAAAAAQAAQGARDGA